MEGTMKAQVFYEPEKMRLEEVEIPRVKANEVLVRVKACGICGSDVAYYYGKSPLETKDGKGPLILGHEFAGEIVEVGEIAKGLGLFAPGDRVLANPVQQCNACPQCLRRQFNLCKNTQTKGVNTNGAFAEYAVMNYTHVYKIGDHLSYEEACICEPLACAGYGVQKLDVQIGDFVVIFGPGTIGLMMLSEIRARGAGKVAMVGILDYGLEKAREMGADYALNTLDANSPYYCADVTAEISRLTNGDLADKVIVPTAAKSALQSALDVSGRCSNIVYFGLPGEDTVLEVPLLKTLQMDKTINVSWLATSSWDIALKMLDGRKVDAEKLITHRFSLEELEEGIRFMNDNGKPEKIKSIVTF